MNIPSGSEDEQDFFDAESDDDIEKIQSIQNFLPEPLSDAETSLSSQRHQCSSPINEVVTNIEKISNQSNQDIKSAKDIKSSV